MRIVLPIAFLLLALAAPAQASFEIDRSLAGVRIGMSEAQVQAKLGAPADTQLGTDFVDWIYRRPAVRVTLKGEVITLYTKSHAQRGPGGIGVGTTETRLKAAVRRVKCSGTGAGRMCVVGSFATGRRSTVFGMRSGRVRDVTISLSTP
jgi:hypothetical protein